MARGGGGSQISAVASDYAGRGGALEHIRCAGDKFEWSNGVGSSSVGFSMVAGVSWCGSSVRGQRRGCRRNWRCQ
jgi:hypothetical protein